MKKLLCLIALAAITLTGFLILASCEVTAGTGTIAGFVYETYTDADTQLDVHSPLAGVTIYYSDGLEPTPAPGASVRSLKSVTTDTNGYFEIFGLTLGTYTLVYSLDGFVTETQSVDLGVTNSSIGTSGTPVTQTNLIADGTNYLNRNFALSNWSGRYSSAKLLPTGNIVLTFSENIDSVLGIADGLGSTVLDNAAISIAGAVVTIDPVQELSAGQTIYLGYTVKVNGKTYSAYQNVYVAGMGRVSSNVTTQYIGGTANTYATSTVPTVTFSETIDSFDLVNAAGTRVTYLQNVTKSKYVDADITASGATLTVTPVAALDAGCTYSLAYYVYSALNNGYNSANGTITFYTQASTVAVPGQVSGLNVYTGHNYNDTNFGYQFDRLSGASSYRLYARISGTTEARLVDTVIDPVANDLVIYDNAPIASGVFGTTFALANNQALDFYLVAVNSEGVEGPASVEVTGIKDDTNNLAYNAGILGAGGSGYNVANAGGSNTTLSIVLSEPVQAGSIGTLSICDATGAAIANPGITFSTPVFGSLNQTTFTVDVTVANAYTVTGNIYFKFTYTDLAGNVVQYNHDNSNATAAVNYAVGFIF